MNAHDTVIFWLALALVFSPGVALVIAWWRFFTHERSPRRLLELAVLCLATVDFALLMASLIYKNVVGPDYSTRRFVTIFTSFAISFLILVLTGYTRGKTQAPLLVSGLLLMIVWAVEAALSSLV